MATVRSKGRKRPRYNKEEWVKKKRKLNKDAGEADETYKETPFFGDSDMEEIIRVKNPRNMPGKHTKLHERLREFSKKVVIIIHTVNDNEYWAAVNLLAKPESDDGTPIPNLKTAVTFPKAGSAVGMFGGYRAALVQTRMGGDCRENVEAALQHFPNAKAIIAVGVAYGRDPGKHKFGDVLVSKSIEEMDTVKFASDGSIIGRGKKEEVKEHLQKIFCKQTGTFAVKKKFKCTKEGRRPNIFPGTIISMSWLVDDEETKTKIFKNSPEAVGGEMEGFILRQVQKKYANQNPPRQLDIIIIKGVADYGDGKKEKIWQFTAAMTAVGYTHFKLEETDQSEFESYQPAQPTVTGEATITPGATTGGGAARSTTAVNGADKIWDKKPALGDLTKVIDKMQGEWSDLALYLGFEQYQIDAINEDEKRSKNKCRVVLGKWLEGPGRGPKSWRTLLVALTEMSKTELVNELEKKLVKK